MIMSGSKSSKRGLGILGMALIAGVVEPLAGPVYAPPWADDPWASRALFEFPTSDPTPAPDISVNSYGAPEATINLGTFATGWQDPSNSLHLTRVSSHGAWDLGEFGNIEIDIPIGNASGNIGFEYYKLDVLVYVIHYYLPPISVQPTLYLNGYSPVSQSYVDALHTPDVIGNWYARTWTASFTGITDDSVKLVVMGGGLREGCVVDDIDVFLLPEVVPEPSSAILLALFGAAVYWGHRRRVAHVTRPG